ncbi:hypothetical protein [Pseudomonas sp. W5-01]|uniref:hypothetical protein n=1 Tax=Pseudomonas sp. W5-01 TaxID=3097454 RepID=UPI00397B92D6
MNKLSIIASALLLATLSGCFNKELTPEEKTLTEALRSELNSTKQEIGVANSTASTYGGAIKLLATARLEILKANEALLEQRIQAIESGAKINIQVPAVQPDQVLASSIANEITTAKAGIAAGQVEANQYGGLIKALKLATVATQEQTLAMLEQRYLSAKYGLPQSAMGAPTSGQLSASTSTSTAVSSPKPSPAPAPQLEERLSIPPADGPLGFAAGLSKNEIEAMTGVTLSLIDEKQSLYGLEKSPKPNSSFAQFALVVSPTAGLCQIRAISKDIHTSRFGYELKSSFDEMKGALTEVYGKPVLMDTLIAGSIWREPKEWMMSLRQKERYLSVAWTATSASPLKYNLSEIEMDARATSSDEGYYMLQYTFNNWNVCQSEAKAKARSSL